MPAIPPAASSATPRLRRLPGRSPWVRMSRAEAAARLWMDDRELVQETVRSHTQELQRFAFADIQAVQIRRTVRGLVYNLVLAGLPALLLLVTLRVWGTGRADGASVAERHLLIAVGVLAPFLLLLIINVLRGPTCRTVLTTALGPQYLPSLSRTRTARRALDAIIAGAERVQGALQPEEAARHVDRAQTPPRSSAQKPPVVAQPAPAPPAPPPDAPY